jgi:hypothetical protein
MQPELAPPQAGCLVVMALGTVVTRVARICRLSQCLGFLLDLLVTG